MALQRCDRIQRIQSNDCKVRKKTSEKSNVVENECNGDGEPIGGISRQNGDECNGHNDYKYPKRIEKKSLPKDLFEVPKEYKLQELRMPRY